MAAFSGSSLSLVPCSCWRGERTENVIGMITTRPTLPNKLPVVDAAITFQLQVAHRRRGTTDAERSATEFLRNPQFKCHKGMKAMRVCLFFCAALSAQLAQPCGAQTNVTGVVVDQ